jgi:hypothetical protein
MLTLKLDEMGLEELSAHEMTLVEGGNIWFRALEYAILVYDAAVDFGKGFVDGFTAKDAPAVK